MPVVINEVIAEVQQPVTRAAEALPMNQQPQSASETEIFMTMERLQQRQQRLLVD